MGAKGAAMASSAAGTAALVYVVLSGRLSPDGAEEAPRRRHGRRGVDGGSEARWPESAPASWREAAAVVARTVRFAYGETLGKWPLGDIAFGISHYMRLQIIGHSMGAAIAAILTYILRENKKLSSSSCIAFGPGIVL
ncbi:uncharacterized protein [Triticum aestivum]|uniref:uncharacterized protein isoform X2 n=1 Tax=Triticum aestivum TaxID=4565 RepID=UPI001D0340D3|nr:uncharacterized protein LOC123074077 isoform X2 [Triticum aestivum]